MEESTTYAVHCSHGRQGKMAPYALRPHGLRSPCQAYGRKAVGLVEVWPGPRQRMIAEIVLAADNVGIHALDTHWHHCPRDQEAGAPGCPRRHSRLKGHLWCPVLVGH